MSSTPVEPAADDSAAAPAEASPSSASDSAEGTPPPAPATGRGKRRHRRAIDPGRGPEPVWDGAAWEDDPRAWGEGREDPDRDSDQRILREKPPHW